MMRNHLPRLSVLFAAGLVSAALAQSGRVASGPAETGGGGAGGSPDEAARKAELAQKLQNPVANLISVPIQNNRDFGIGSEDAMRYTANIQPDIPFSLSEDWNVITRTILPVIYAEAPVAGGDDEFGLGDTVQSFFLSPKEPVHGFSVQQLLKIGKQPIAFQVGYRYYAEEPDGGPDWGLRFAITFRFPK
jgi:hypothetical protein